jgi:hypothetical protein
MERKSTTRWATATEKWEYTFTTVPLDGEAGRPEGFVAGCAMNATPEGKSSSTWTPFSVSSGENSAIVWWRRTVISTD